MFKTFSCVNIDSIEYILLFIAELFALFFLSSVLTRLLSQVIYAVSKNKRATVVLLALIFFPGVMVHELAHFLVASLLFVRAENIQFIPEINGSEVRLGTVSIAKTDPLRRFLIGAAPIIVGIALIAGSFVFLELNALNALWKQILFGYILFVIGNTMYSSRKDMEGAIELFGTIGVILLIGFLMGIRFSLPVVNVSAELVEQTKNLNLFLLLPISIDVGVIGLTKVFLRSST